MTGYSTIFCLLVLALSATDSRAAGDRLEPSVTQLVVGIAPDWDSMTGKLQRFDKTVFVRSEPFTKSEQRSAEEEELGVPPKEPLLSGERILQCGVLELKAALLDKESGAKEN